MATIILLVLAVSLDALSFGLAKGFSKNKIGFINTLAMTILSTIFFTVPLYLSGFVAKYLSEDLCFLINGVVLLLLGLFYLIKSIIKPENCEFDNTKLTLKYCLVSTIPISLDAIFTAFLTGYSIDYIIFGVIFYFVITFLFIYIPNIIALKISKSAKINIEWLSGVIFIILGILKLLEI